MAPDGPHVNPSGCGVCSGLSITHVGESGHSGGCGGVVEGQGTHALPTLRLTPKAPTPHARAITFHDISDLDRSFFMGPHVPTPAPLVTQTILSYRGRWLDSDPLPFQPL